jgi:hypothetical protein
VAIGTFVLAFVAVFQDWLQQWVMSPSLRLKEPRVGPPDAERTTMHLFGVDLEGLQLPEPLEEVPVYYFRLAITNAGRSAARDVQVFLSAVKKQNKVDGTYAPVERFTPLNLMWSHTNTPTLPVLVQGPQSRFCALAHIIQPNAKHILKEDLLDMSSASPILALDLEVKPNSLGHLLEPDTYLFDLILMASNCAPQPYKLKVDFLGEWFDNPQQMFSDGFRMSLHS